MSTPRILGIPLLFITLWACAQDGGDPGPEAMLPPDAAAEAPTEAPPAEEPPADEPPVDEPPVDPCSACHGRCVEGLATECRSVMAVLDPVHHAEFAACYRANPCEPDQTRRCLEALTCDADLVVGQHCDALARCAMDGRGYLDEEACRTDPYQEPLLWACLGPERRAAIGQCLVAQPCGDLETCVRMAACEEGVCPPTLNTRLAVDCHRICSDGGDQYCHPGADRFATCFDHCDQAALRLADAHRRSYEACALEPDRCGGDCIAALVCDAAPLSAALGDLEARCGPADEVAENINQYACLGEVIQTGIAACLVHAPCAEVPACIAEATCGDAPDCLAFLAGR